MEIKKIFRGISEKLLSDFNISANINHTTSKGNYREKTLLNFLKNGYLPEKYGVGSGEIVSSINQTSKQSDLIIFDKFNGIPFLYSEETQIYPIESVYGIIEVKSKLTKPELIIALENIKSVKELCPEENISISPISMFQVIQPRPIPFGIVFAYSLGENSIESLTKNVKEWQSQNSPKLWPNLIVILNEGLIYHEREMFQKVYQTKYFTKELYTSNFPWKKDTLLHFYMILLDLCRSMHLGPAELAKYLEIREKIGNYIVSNHDRWSRPDPTNPKKQIPMKLTLKCIEKIVSYCKVKGKISQREQLLKQFGSIPFGVTESFLNSLNYFYDPENLPGIHELENPFETDEQGHYRTTKRSSSPSTFIIIDDETYYMPQAYLEEEDLEENTTKIDQDLEE